MATLDDPLHHDDDDTSSSSSSGSGSSGSDHFMSFVYCIIIWFIVTMIYVALAARPLSGVVSLRDGHIHQFVVLAAYIILWSYIAQQQWHHFDSILVISKQWQQRQQHAAANDGTTATGERNPNQRYEACLILWLVIDMYARAYMCWPWIHLMIIRLRDTYRPWCTSSYERWIYRTPWITGMIIVPLLHVLLSSIVWVSPNQLVSGLWSCIIWAAAIQFGVTRWCIAYRDDHIRRALYYCASGGCDEPIDHDEIKHMINYAHGRFGSPLSSSSSIGSPSRVLFTPPSVLMIDTITNMLDSTIRRYGIIRPISRMIASYYVSPSLIKPTSVHMTHRPQPSLANHHMGMILNMMDDHVIDRLATELWISRDGLDAAITKAMTTPGQFGLIPSISVPLQLGDDTSSSSLSRGLQLRLPVRWVRKPAIRDSHDVGIWKQLRTDAHTFITDLWTAPKRVWPSTVNRGYYELDTSSCAHVHAAADRIERNWATITHVQHWLRTPMTDVTLSHLYDTRHYHHTRVHHHHDPLHASSSLSSSWPSPSLSELPIRGAPWSIPYPGSRFDHQQPPPMILYVNVTLQCPLVTHHRDGSETEPAISVADIPFRLTFDAAYWERPTCCDTITCIKGATDGGCHDNKRESTADLLHRVLVSIHDE